METSENSESLDNKNISDYKSLKEHLASMGQSLDELIDNLQRQQERLTKQEIKEIANEIYKTLDVKIEQKVKNTFYKFLEDALKSKEIDSPPESEDSNAQTSR